MYVGSLAGLRLVVVLILIYFNGANYIFANVILNKLTTKKLKKRICLVSLYDKNLLNYASFLTFNRQYTGHIVFVLSLTSYVPLQVKKKIKCTLKEKNANRKTTKP